VSRHLLARILGKAGRAPKNCQEASKFCCHNTLTSFVRHYSIFYFELWTSNEKKKLVLLRGFRRGNRSRERISVCWTEKMEDCRRVVRNHRTTTAAKKTNRTNAYVIRPGTRESRTAQLPYRQQGRPQPVLRHCRKVFSRVNIIAFFCLTGFALRNFVGERVQKSAKSVGTPYAQPAKGVRVVVFFGFGEPCGKEDDGKQLASRS
jgi:hypothetical protein